MKKTTIVLLTIISSVILLKAQSAFEIQKQSIQAKTILDPQLAGGLMSSAYMKSGTLRITNDVIIISGQAFIELPVDQARSMVSVPDGYDITNMTIGRFNRTTNGFEFTASFVK
jgi:hypothetical protein